MWKDAKKYKNKSYGIDGKIARSMIVGKNVYKGPLRRNAIFWLQRQSIFAQIISMMPNELEKPFNAMFCWKYYLIIK